MAQLNSLLPVQLPLLTRKPESKQRMATPGEKAIKRRNTVGEEGGTPCLSMHGYMVCKCVCTALIPLGKKNQLNVPPENTLPNVPEVQGTI